MWFSPTFLLKCGVFPGKSETITINVIFFVGKIVGFVGKMVYNLVTKYLVITIKHP